MGRRNQSIFDVLIGYPWWVSIALAVVFYIFSVLIIPFIPIPDPMIMAFTSGIARIGPIVSFLFLIVAGLSAFYGYRKGKQLERQTSIDSIGELSWRRFESLVSEAFRRKGYMVLDNINDGPDGGVDIILRKDGQVVFVQCKHWKTRQVGVNVVRELLGAMTSKKVSNGIVVTYGGFTQEAYEFAKPNSIHLIDGSELTKLVASVQKIKKIETASKTDKSCPKCGKQMVLRVARKGPHAGKSFWGCSGFPNCRYTAAEN